MVGMRWVALALLIVPIVELWLLLQIGDVFGLWVTVALLIGTAFAGAWLAKREGLRVLRSWHQATAELRLPDEGVTSGLLVLVGAALLMTPGVLTDVAGIACLVPVSRRALARLIERHLAARFTVARMGFDVRVPRGDDVFRRGYAGPGRVFDVEGELLEESDGHRAR